MKYVTDEHLSLIGKPGPRQTAPQAVNEDALRRFVQAVMETDPVHYDEAVARKSRYGGLVGPPLFPLHTFRRAPGTEDPLDRLDGEPDWDGVGGDESDGLPVLEFPLKRVLNGGTEATFFRLAKVDDVILWQSRYVGIEEREGRSGPMVIVTVETEYTNQRDEPLMRVRTTWIHR